ETRYRSIVVTQLLVELWCVLHSRIVEGHHFFERPETPVVHVRTGNRNIAQRRCLEAAFSRAGIARYDIETIVSRARQPLHVGGMAARAACISDKQFETAAFLGGQVTEL